MNDEKNYIHRFIEEFLVPKIGVKPFQNLKDIRNRKKIFKTLNEIFESDLEINLTEEQKEQLKTNILKKYERKK